MISAKASEGECLLQLGKVTEAISKFEGVKKDINKEVVFDKPIIYINVCNQLGNCYLKMNDLNKALSNFEDSLFLINKYQDKSLINEVIVAQICQNIAMISGEKGYLNDCIKMHERALNYKQKVLPQYH